MKFMMLMIPGVYQNGKKMDPHFKPDLKKMEEMGRARVSFAKGKPTVVDGSFIEAKEVLGGYWMVEAKSKDEVVKWAQRCPADDGDVIEIRQIFDLAELENKK